MDQDLNEVLLEELGVFLEEKNQIPPVAARIYGYLILDANQGVTFEALVKTIKASKSTISTNLKLLKSKRFITHFTKCGDRKKYFKTDEDHIFLLIENKINHWKKEKFLHEKILQHKLERFKDNPEFKNKDIGLNFNELFIEYANMMVEQLTKIQTKLKQLKNEK